MKATDLRIGNYIYMPFIKDNVKVVGIPLTSNKTTFIQSTISDNHFFFETEEKYLPIPLTEELLLKCGFNTQYKKGFIGIDVKHENGTTTDFVLSYPQRLGVWQNNFSFDYNEYRFIELEFLHQLQNLYFALTGKEFEINL